MTAHAFNVPTDDERAELAALGIELSDSNVLHFPTEQAARDAAASRLLRAVGRLDADLERYATARAEEHRLVQEAFERLAAPVADRKAILESMLRQIAEFSDFGDAKSRKVTNGVYGRRLTPERISITDQKKCLAWALTNEPSMVSEKPAEKRVLQSAVEAFVKRTHCLPDGVEHTMAVDEPYFRVEIPKVMR